MKEKTLFKIVSGLLILILLASCSISLPIHQAKKEARLARIIQKQEAKTAKIAFEQKIEDAKREAELARIKADTLSTQRTTVQHYNDPYYFNRFTAGFQGRYFYQPHPIIIRRNYGNNRRNINISRSSNRRGNSNVIRIPKRANNNSVRQPVRVPRQQPSRGSGRLPTRPVKNKGTVKQ